MNVSLQHRAESAWRGCRIHRRDLCSEKSLPTPKIEPSQLRGAVEYTDRISAVRKVCPPQDRAESAWRGFRIHRQDLCSEKSLPTHKIEPSQLGGAVEYTDRISAVRKVCPPQDRAESAWRGCRIHRQDLCSEESLPTPKIEPSQLGGAAEYTDRISAVRKVCPPPR